MENSNSTLEELKKSLLEKKSKKNSSPEQTENKNIKVLREDKTLMEFKIREASITQKKEKKEVSLISLFIEPKSGKILTYFDFEECEFKLTGEIACNNQGTCEIESSSTKIVFKSAKLGVQDNFYAYTCRSEDKSLSIIFDLDHWSGYYVQWGNNAMDLWFSRDRQNLVGLSSDPCGYAAWRGVMSDTNFNTIKRYLKAHQVDYDGTCKYEDGKTKIDGRWMISGWGEPFHMECEDRSKML